jgi:hypothetical protein
VKYQPTTRTRALLNLEVTADVRARLLALFATDVALIGPTLPAALDRVQFAAVKLALSGEQGLFLAEHYWSTDVRDLLMSAGFGHDLGAHERWFGEMVPGASIHEQAHGAGCSSAATRRSASSSAGRDAVR